MYGFLFFFNDTATSYSYTYLHTPSLHDALPIWRQGVGRLAGTRRRGALRGPRPQAHAQPGKRDRERGRASLCARPETGDDDALPRRVRRKRSEEHTSELQSLMRISYAVFCLKKHKTIITTTRRNTTHQDH